MYLLENEYFISVVEVQSNKDTLHEVELLHELLEVNMEEYTLVPF